MADDRPLPPSARRIALARRAGLVPRSAILVAGAAWTGAAIGVWLAATRARDLLAAAMHQAAGAVEGVATAAIDAPGTAPLTAAAAVTAVDATGTAAPTVAAAVTAVDATGSAAAIPGLPTTTELIVAVLGVAAPLIVGAALAAVAAHMAQTRQLVVPRRVIQGAPRPARGVDRRTADAGLAAIRAAAAAAVAIGWAWAHLDDLGALPELPTAAVLSSTAALAISAVAHLAAALLVAGALDLGVAVLRHRADLRMTRVEAAADARAGGIDPRWRRTRPVLDGDAAAVRTARVVITGDGAAAVRYHATLWPRPTVTAVGRGLDATRLLELARRHRVPIHHAPALARALRGVARGGDVPDSARPTLAEVLAVHHDDPS